MMLFYTWGEKEILYSPLIVTAVVECSVKDYMLVYILQMYLLLHRLIVFLLLNLLIFCVYFTFLFVSSCSLFFLLAVRIPLSRFWFLRSAAASSGQSRSLPLSNKIFFIWQVSLFIKIFSRVKNKQKTAVFFCHKHPTPLNRFPQTESRLYFTFTSVRIANIMMPPF